MLDGVILEDSKLAWDAPGQLVTGWREKKEGGVGPMGDLCTELARGQIAAVIRVGVSSYSQPRLQRAHSFSRDS